MDGADDDEVVSLGDLAEIVDDFPARGRVEAAGWFVEEEEFR